MKKIKFPIFLKLLLLFAVFIIIVNLTAGFIAKMSLGTDPVIMINNYIMSLNEYIIKDIGNPIDLKRAEEIAKDKNLDIRIETDELNWSNSDRIPDLKELRTFPEFREGAQNFPMRFKGGPLFFTKINNGYIIISPAKHIVFIEREKAILLIILAISILTLVLYFALRWIFGPIKSISKDIEEISKGNLNTRIILNRSDELGRLADSINEMKEKISNMINSKESLLIDVSHELRSPLTRIKLACEFIDDEKLRKKINEDVNELESMIKGLLDTYRNENAGVEINREDLNLSELLNNVAIKFNSDRLININESGDFFINADKVGMETVLRNVIDNALKYSEDKPVTVKLSGNKDTAKLSIMDDGKGIEKDELVKIFEPFYRTDKSRNKKIQGYGLGLSLVKKILDGHGLQHEIKSESGVGSEFIIHFPLIR
ncbi:MAG: HAMP domain-containing sensor histidine kinase [Ignavibacteria bacterium]